MRWISVAVPVSREWQAEEQFRARPVVFQFDQSQRGDDVGQRGGHFIRDAVEQNLLFLDFGIQSLMRDHRFACPLQNRFFGLERFPETFEEQDRVAVHGRRGRFELHLCAARVLFHPRSRFGAFGAAFLPAFLGVDQEVLQKGRCIRDRQEAAALPERRPERGEPAALPDNRNSRSFTQTKQAELDQDGLSGQLPSVR
jgi:hypothetical protein